jgi:hypothetical protein
MLASGVSVVKVTALGATVSIAPLIGEVLVSEFAKLAEPVEIANVSESISNATKFVLLVTT